MTKKYIAVAGNMGSGKSSLVDFLCKYYKLKPFYEPNEMNPYLEDFYEDMRRWAFHSQLFFLSNKFRIHQELAEDPGTVVQDRTIYEDAEIFAKHLYLRGLIEKRDYATYQDLYRTILRSLNPPDLMIYLHCPLRTIRRRIRSRGRLMEQEIPSEYIKRLQSLYKEWFNRYDLSPTLEFSTDKLEYLGNFLDRKDLLSQIEKHL